MSLYNPFHWYWKADDGRLYSSKAQALVSETDSDYQGWIAFPDQRPTPWPRDDAGEQTDESLQAVLDPVGTIFVNLDFYAANARWRKEQGGMTVRTAGGSFPIKTDDRSQAKINGVRLLADSKNSVSVGATTMWYAADRTLHEVDVDGVISISDQLQQFINQTFLTLSDVTSAIASGGITTHAQIDAAFNDMPMTFEISIAVSDRESGARVNR